MSQADVRSVEALRELHAAMCKYRADAIDALSAVELSIRRSNDWLGEQLIHWQAAKKKGEEEVFVAKQDLAQRKYVGWDGRVPDTSVQEAALKRALAKVQHCDDKIAAVRRWQTKLPHAVSETYEGPSRQLSATIESELPRGLALLERRIIALEQYLAIAPAATPAPPPIEPPPAENPT